MRTTFRLAFEDYYDAEQARNAKNRYVTTFAILAMTLLLGLVLMRQPVTQGGHPLVALVLAFLVLVGAVRAVRWLDKRSFERSFNRDANDAKVCTVDISESGIELLDPPQRDEWSSFSKYSESDKSFILYQGTSVYAIFPKRALHLEDVEHVRRILNARLPKH